VTDPILGQSGNLAARAVVTEPGGSPAVPGHARLAATPEPSLQAARGGKDQPPGVWATMIVCRHPGRLPVAVSVLVLAPPQA
jgi:hypothetical protein